MLARRTGRRAADHSSLQDSEVPPAVAAVVPGFAVREDDAEAAAAAAAAVAVAPVDAAEVADVDEAGDDAGPAAVAAGSLAGPVASARGHCFAVG